jgi:uncharacterized protein (DUF427 family)
MPSISIAGEPIARIACYTQRMAEHVRLEPVPRIRVRLGGETIVDTTHGYVVHEGTLSDRYYVPPGDVRGTLTPTTDGAHCPWKGERRHLDLAAGGQTIAKAAWTYYETTPVCAPITDFVAFYANKLDIEVG